ncbi:MAG: bifunctional glutamate N-acetyltransferase/amino-acid acetyltransferase ArgJ, partial [Acidimicrobiales bacterium]|nr:bifunctional glutamate N-acetyltransferase/amino-acid acetyltransferase ArgJ [Acidimicrobiales bacterium]
MSVTAATGFVAAGTACGVKPDGGLDLALVTTDDGVAVPAAAVFTSNLMCAAPVTVSRENLQSTAGRAAAVILNSGNANAATGEPGIEAARAMCVAVAAELGCDYRQVLVCSTGLIGIALPVERITAAVPALVAARSVDGSSAARAIMTTDTVPKEVTVDRGAFTVGGMAKGAAMLAPNMATMLAVLTTDAAAESTELQEILRTAVTTTFNALTIDGCTSTNDTVVLLASGRKGRQDLDLLAEAVHEACGELATAMAADAEGATKTVRIKVTGAHSDAEAARAARKVAESQLCKCSWYGADPYWGRIASELGSAGVRFDQRLVSIAYGGIEV